MGALFQGRCPRLSHVAPLGQETKPENLFPIAPTSVITTAVGNCQKFEMAIIRFIADLTRNSPDLKKVSSYA